jgi:hypothetical protein
MRRLASLLPTTGAIVRNRARIAGFAFGVVAPLVLSAFVTVIYTGHGLSETPVAPAPVYPDF